MTIIQSEFLASLPDRVGAEQKEVPLIPQRPKTLSSRLYYSVAEIGTSLSPYGKGYFTIAVMGTGYTLGTLFAISEAVSLLALGLIVNLTHHATGEHFSALNDMSLRVYSMSLESLAIGILQVTLLLKQAFSEYHSFNLLTVHAVHHISYPLLSIFGKIETDYFISSAKDFIENGSLLEVLQSLRADFRPNVSAEEFRAKLNERSLQTFFILYPEYNSTFQKDFFSILDQEYRENYRKCVSRFIDYLFEPLPDFPDTEINSGYDKEYQNILCRHIKKAFKDIYESDTLVAYIEGGKDAFDGFYGSIFLPLARYATLLELEANEMHCPSTDLMIERYTLLESCRNRIKRIKNVQDREALIKCLLTGESQDELVRDIAILAGELHQGKLLTRVTYNIFTRTRSDTKLFDKACQEALQELTAN